MFHGPEDADYLVVLAPGDACALTDRTPTAIAEGLGAAGLRVVRFACPLVERGAWDELDALLEDHIRDAAAARRERQALVLGGVSRGARVSLGLVEALGAVGLLAYAYPFHARTDPDPGHRVRDLAGIGVPALICQGTRDSLGNREQVRGYRLPAHVQVHWLEDANHALEPRVRSGRDLVEELGRAVAASARFVRSLT